jgi:hypothetical protein
MKANPTYHEDVAKAEAEMEEGKKSISSLEQ